MRVKGWAVQAWSYMDMMNRTAVYSRFGRNRKRAPVCVYALCMCVYMYVCICMRVLIMGERGLVEEHTSCVASVRCVLCVSVSAGASGSPPGPEASSSGAEPSC